MGGNNNPTWLTEFETLAREISVMNWYPFPWVFPGGWGAGAPPTPGGWPEPTKEEISREAKAIDIGTHPAG